MINADCVKVSGHKSSHVTYSPYEVRALPSTSGTTHYLQEP